MSASSAFGPERRQTPRVSVAALTYICFESDDNGGVVQNISEGGLCLRVIVPIEAGGTVRLWCLVEGRRVEVEAHVAWVDESGKTGGLSFTILSSRPHDEIRKWLSAPTTPAMRPQPLRPIGGVRRWVDRVIRFWNTPVGRTRSPANAYRSGEVSVDDGDLGG